MAYKKETKANASGSLIRKTRSSIENSVLLKVILEPKASFMPY